MYISPRNTKYNIAADTSKVVIGYQKDCQHIYRIWIAEHIVNLHKTQCEDFSYIVQKPFAESEVGKYISGNNAIINRDNSLLGLSISDKVIPVELESLNKEIVRSQYILDLENNEDWNEYGNHIISPELYKTTIDFLVNQCVYIFRQFGIVIQPPEINPCPNGTIDLSWRTEKSRLLINVKSSPKGYLAYYYGDYYNNDSPIKGYVFVNKVSAFLAVWMRDLN